MPSVSNTWDGPSKIILGIDLGTTYSAVSYSYLYKGGPRVITSVSKWPDQRDQSGHTKIPTLVWYDKHKKPVKCGASALVANGMEAKENGWQLAKHFKLNMHPKTMGSTHGLQAVELPDGVTLEQVYSDFMAYLLKHAGRFFQERVPDGVTVWNRYIGSADVIITHPNGWGLREQTILRRAAIAAGFPDPQKTGAQIRFVTEAEASVHFCIFKAGVGPLQEGDQFAVCDAGGSTVDITAYEVTRTRPTLQLQEKGVSACIQAGAIFVDDIAQRHIRSLLSNSDWIKHAQFDDEDVEDSIQRGLANFEAEKKLFGADIEELKLEVVSSRLKYKVKNVHIQRGALVLDKGTLSSFFDPCVNQIVATLKKQIEGLNVKDVLLVGGFGESPYLRGKLAHEMANRGRRVAIANDFTSKAVADGAVLWSMQATVDGRACRFTYGIHVLRRYDLGNPEHVGRTRHPYSDGSDVIQNSWSQIAPRGLIVKTNDKITKEYYKFYSTSKPALETFTIKLYAFTPPDRVAPQFMRDPEDTRASNDLREGFESVCVLSADLRGLAGALEHKLGPKGEYWKLVFNICVQFGGVELEAFVEWIEKGIPRRGKVSIVPNED